MMTQIRNIYHDEGYTFGLVAPYSIICGNDIYLRTGDRDPQVP